MFLAAMDKERLMGTMGYDGSSDVSEPEDVPTGGMSPTPGVPISNNPIQKSYKGKIYSASN